MIPRHLPLGLAARAAVFTVPGLVASLLLLQGLIFAAVFGSMSDVAGLRDWRGPVERGEGVVVGLEATSTRVNSRRVMAVEFEHAHGGGTWTATSYGVGLQLAPGARVAVEWPAGKPEGARIVGLGRKQMPEWVLLPALLPSVVGVIVALFAVRSGRRRVRLLKLGRVTQGRVVARESTRTRVNRQRVYKVRFVYTRADGRTGESVVRTHRADGLVEGAEETLLYDVEGRDGDPALLVKQMAGVERVTDDEVVGRGGVGGVVALLLPVVVVGGWCVVAWWLMLLR